MQITTGGRWRCLIVKMRYFSKPLLSLNLVHILGEQENTKRYCRIRGCHMITFELDFEEILLIIRRLELRRLMVPSRTEKYWSVVNIHVVTA